MKKLMTFIKLTFTGGLLVLLPLLLFILLIMEIFELVQGLAAPIALLFPQGTFDRPEHPVLLSILLITGASFFIGLAMKSMSIQNMGKWIEKKTIGRLPIYKFVKTLVPSLVEKKDGPGFQPALFNAANGCQEFIYIVEELEDGRLAALFPMAPTGFSGPVKIISKDLVSPLDAGAGDLSLVLNHMGMGSGQLLKKNHKAD